MVDVAGGCDDEGRGAVVGLVVLPYISSFHIADRLGRSADGATDRTIAVDGQLEGVVDRVRG